MKPIDVEPLKQNKIIDLYSIRQMIDMKPSYQRQGDIWSEPKQQLLIDSILNGFDLPKLYFHNTEDINAQDGRRYRYAVIDGKQRLESIWGFINDDYPLAEDFELFENPGLEMAGLKYSELANRFPKIHARFESYKLPIQVVSTSDIEMIEEMFSRLNEAVPLNAPEKRNALGGPLPPKIRQLAQHEFFTTRLPFPNNRYKHLDLATKFLYVEFKGGATDTKKRNLDEFVDLFRQENRFVDAEHLSARVQSTIEKMSPIFLHRDFLLSSVGMVVVYYLVFRELSVKPDGSQLLKRHRFVDFEELRQQNRTFYREAQDRQLQMTLPAQSMVRNIDPNLLEFDRLMQSPNDKGALELRSSMLRDFLLK